MIACYWSRDRGVCASTLRVRYPELEARVLGATRSQVLVPSSVAYVVERAMRLVQQRRADPRLEAKRTRLAELCLARSSGWWPSRPGWTAWTRSRRASPR